MSGTAAELAAQNYSRGKAVAQNFPSDLQEILKRRSSRDPATRFARKLHALLSYVSGDPHLEEEAGLGWIDDSVFRIFKSRLLGVLGLKLNTLNVNLRDLNFTQLQGDKTGWTRWRRDGFTRRAFAVGRRGEELPPQEVFPRRQIRLPVEEISVPINHVAHISPAELEALRHHVFCEWEQIVGTQVDYSVASVFFIAKAAARYRLQQQSSQNAFDVIQAILTPQTTLSIKIEDFARFLAKFGPRETIMLKIHSLLEAAAVPEPWLYFGMIPTDDGIVFGAFDDDEPNALVIRKGNDILDRVWNLPMVPFGGLFIMDKDRRMYGSWEEYFQANPVPVESQIGYR
jgi:hypothetical protein